MFSRSSAKGGKRASRRYRPFAFDVQFMKLE